MCSSDFELQAYFDTETGEIILVPYEPDGETVYDLEAISRLHAWEQEMAEDIKAIYENEGSPETLERSAVADQFFESWVFSEIYKSYLNAGRRPPVFYYRDKDQKEIDLLLLQDGTLYPKAPPQAKRQSSILRHWNRQPNLNATANQNNTGLQ